MSKFWKLTPAIALTTAIALLLAGIIMALYIDRSYRAQKIDEVGVQARILASTVTAAVFFNDRKSAQEYVNALAANPEVQVAAIYGAGGSLIASYSSSPDRTAPPAAQPRDPYFADDRLIVIAPVTQGGLSLGAVYLQTITEPFARRLERYGVVALLLIMAAVLIGVLAIAHSALTRAHASLEKQALDLARVNHDLRSQIEQREIVEEALRQAQKMEAIGQLTGGVAHDFNNLLQVILGNLDSLRRRMSDGSAEIRRTVDAAIRGAERAAILTQRLLAFSRRQPLAPRPLDVNKLVAGMSDLLHRTLGEAITVETVLAGGLWRISADANQLENAVLNLAVNARDAMPEGGRLTVATANEVWDAKDAAFQDDERPGQYVVIAVTDNGVGMTKDIVLKAFEPFFTTKDVGKGSGLGLSQVYGFMRQSGGHAKIYSEPDKGTTVKLYLPRFVDAGD